MYFTVSAKGRKGHNFDHMGYMYQLDIDFLGKIEDFYIYADNRKAAISISNEIVKTINYNTTIQDIQTEVTKQNGKQQLKVAYRMLDTHEDKEKVMNYIQRLKAHFNIDNDTQHESTQQSNQVETTEETPAQEENNEQETTNTQINVTNTYYTAYNRTFSTYSEAFQYCLSCDFDPAYIETVEQSAVSHNALQLDLQLFANTQRKLYESGYTSVKIITTNGEYIARIHPSDEHSNKHKVCYSSDDYFYINDSDILDVIQIYKKSFITPEGVQKTGIGRHLDLSYTVETTKGDPVLDEMYFSNIIKYECKSIHSALERFNRCQKLGYHNLQIVTNVTYKKDIIIQDVTESNTELYINTEYMDGLRKDNRQLEKEKEEMLKAISMYQGFISKYNAQKTYENYVSDVQNDNVSNDPYKSKAV